MVKKNFTLPDNSIPEAGRMVQCGFCGLKWKQFPIKEPIGAKSEIYKIESSLQKVTKIPKKKSRKAKKRTGPDLYSPEYLSKKHGIKLVIHPKFQIKLIKQIKK